MTTVRNRRARYLVRMGTITQQFYEAGPAFVAISNYLRAYTSTPIRSYRPLRCAAKMPPYPDGIGTQWTYTNDRGMVLATIRRVA